MRSWAVENAARLPPEQTICSRCPNALGALHENPPPMVQDDSEAGRLVKMSSVMLPAAPFPRFAAVRLNVTGTDCGNGDEAADPNMCRSGSGGGGVMVTLQAAPLLPSSRSSTTLA